MLKATTKRTFFEMVKYSFKFRKEIQRNKETILQLEYLKDSMNYSLSEKIVIMTAKDRVSTTIEKLKKINLYIIRNGSSAKSLIHSSILNPPEFYTERYRWEKSVENMHKSDEEKWDMFEERLEAGFGYYPASKAAFYANYIIDRIQYYLDYYLSEEISECKRISFIVLRDIYRDDWSKEKGHNHKLVFAEGQISTGILHDDGEVETESRYEKGLILHITQEAIEIF